MLTPSAAPPITDEGPRLRFHGVLLAALDEKSVLRGGVPGADFPGAQDADGAVDPWTEEPSVLLPDLSMTGISSSSKCVRHSP